MNICLLSRKMDTYISKADPSILLCLGVTAAFGIITFYRAKKNQVQKKYIFGQGFLLLLLLGIFCFATLKSYVSLTLLPVACLIYYVYLPVQIMLPVDKKAVLITGLWGVVNNAGVLGFPGDGELLPMSMYKQCMEVNFFGPVEVTKMFLPLLRKSKGRLINISSMAGCIPLARFAAYGSSKAALSMFSGVMRQELAQWGVKVAAVHPTGFRTSITGTPELWAQKKNHLLENLTPELKKDYGEDYIEALKNVLLNMSVNCASDLSPVLDDILHALLATSPRGSYTPGKHAYLSVCIFCYFPLWLYDFFTAKFQRSKNVPSALKVFEAKSKNI
nr:estradiol 17-beta-dehydrogenase 2 isoform X3 [Pelodiscus sinensis]|eukprot:XP_014428905.1 estradiol 17-beta-dehydrogenase 2 isoform X3 [Pelodiscus sinensis]